jgi:biotin transporter BioY
MAEEKVATETDQRYGVGYCVIDEMRSADPDVLKVVGPPILQQGSILGYILIPGYLTSFVAHNHVPGWCKAPTRRWGLFHRYIQPVGSHIVLPAGVKHLHLLLR